MKNIFLLVLTSLSFSSFANPQLIKSCFNEEKKIEVNIYEQGISSINQERNLYKIEVLENSNVIYTTLYGLYSKTNKEYYSSSSFSMNLKFNNNIRLYLDTRNRYGEQSEPNFNTLKLECLN